MIDVYIVSFHLNMQHMMMLAYNVIMYAGAITVTKAFINSFFHVQVSELQDVIFYHEDTVYSTDVFEYVQMAVSFTLFFVYHLTTFLKVSYNEPDNVTCSMCGWSTHNWQLVLVII